MRRTQKRSNNNQTINLQLTAPGKSTRTKKSTINGVDHTVNGMKRLEDKNSRTFETRLVPRYEEIPPLPSDLPKGTFSEAAQKILKERYLLKGGNLEVAETIEDRFWHVAYDLASAELDFGSTEEEVMQKARKFYEIMITQEFEPNSPTLMNAGKRNGLQYSACFVLPVEDSLPGIFDAIKYAALIHQTGGGTGFSFSRIRPSGSRVRTTGGVASGPVSFLKVFNAATESIKQGGTRRGANMGILRIDHPDILEFIRCKAELDDNNRPIYESIAPLLPDDESRNYFKTLLLDRQISNFNISVAVTDKFMEAYYKGEDYELINPHNGEVAGTLNAKEVFDEIIDRAWHTGDPGLVFIDRINNSTANPVQELEVIEATNPCGEQPLAPWDACNLGSINLGKFVKADGSSVDWERLKDVVHIAVNLLDNVVQVNPYTLKQIYDEVHNNRRIGLGVMGWADMLFKLKIKYDSEEALKLAEEVMSFINREGHKASQELAKVRGAFPNWPYSIYKDDKPLRNSTVTTIAPTGTISIIADCSSGIEPVFALAYIHRAKSVGDQYRTLVIANQTFEEIAKREGFYSEDLAQKVMERGTVRGLDDVPSEWQEVFVTAQEIDPEWHVKMQAAFQKYTDNGVSKTINLPNSATREDVRKAYLLAWETGCKGITVYRDGSKAVQVLNVASSLKKKEGKEQSVEAEITASRPSFVDRPMVLHGRTYEVLTPVGKAFITINRDDKGNPMELFATVGKGGMHVMADAEAIGRLASIALRASSDPKLTARKISQQLRGIGGSSQIGFGKDRVMSLADAIAKVLAEDLAYVESEGTNKETLPLQLSASNNTNGSTQQLSMMDAQEFAVNRSGDLCPECGNATLVFEEGCSKCFSCGYSKC